MKRLCAAFKKIALIGRCCELPASAFSGGGICITHPNGIIVSAFASIGEDCTILQQVTIGQDKFKDDNKAPIIGDRVFIGAGAKIIGPICVGNDVKIGANAVVTKDVPDGVTVVGFNRIVNR